MKLLQKLLTVLFTVFLLMFNYSYIVNIMDSIEMDKLTKIEGIHIKHPLINLGNTDYYSSILSNATFFVLIAIACSSNRILKLSTF